MTAPKPPPDTSWISTGRPEGAPKSDDRIRGHRPPSAVLSLPRWYRLAAILSSLVLIGGMNIAWTAHVDQRRADEVRRLDRERDRAEREADRRWCTLLGTLDRAYTATAPSTDLGRNVASAIHEVLVSLDCPT